MLSAPRFIIRKTFGLYDRNLIKVNILIIYMTNCCNFVEYRVKSMAITSDLQH